MQPRYISHQIIKPVARNFTRSVQINPLKFLHDLRMVRDFKIGHDRLPVFFDFHVAAVVFADRNGRIDDIGDRHHDLIYFFLQLTLLCFQFCQMLRIFLYLRFQCHGFVFFALTHQCADLFGNHIPAGTKRVCFLFCFSGLRVQSNHFIHQRQFVILKFVFNVLLYDFRIFP